jgi:hypothetical protein
MGKALSEFIQFNSYLTLVLFLIPWFLGVAILLSEFTVLPFIKLCKWFYHSYLFKGINDNKRIEFKAYTFKTELWGYKNEIEEISKWIQIRCSVYKLKEFLSGKEV